jgi:hypothetical protein
MASEFRAQSQEMPGESVGMRRGVFMWIMWVLVHFDYFSSPWATSSDPYFALSLRVCFFRNRPVKRLLKGSRDRLQSANSGTTRLPPLYSKPCVNEKSRSHQDIDLHRILIG